ncbi:MAG TPA: hypothetical protein VK843_07605 [Planctomycetota bacterium]|nr:hypothetical protein [Planctomycetota bacterium]
MQVLHPDPSPAASSSRRRWLLFALLALPPLVALLFIRQYTTRFPLTDEWAFVRSVAELQDIDWSQDGAFAKATKVATLVFSGHIVAVPFFLYWLLAPLTNFDNRFFACFTLATFFLQVLLYRRWFGRWTIALFPIVLLMFCPSHYMEFEWGFEFTLALSVLFPLAGLSVVDRIEVGDPWRTRYRKLAVGLALVMLGALSSFGGLFGFVCLPLLILLGPLERKSKLALITPAVLIAAVVWFWLYSDVHAEKTFGLREVWVVLTALGATIWGSPVGLFEFGFDHRSATGALILACLIASFVVAVRSRRVAKIALPLSFAGFGFLCIAAIAVGRPYLGNWHLQYALPAVCGTFACVYGMWREEPRLPSRLAPLVLMSAILLASLSGCLRGFTEYGPHYRAYVADLEHTALRILEHPALAKTLPAGPELDADLVLYFAARGHPLFAPDHPPRLDRVIDEARVFARKIELTEPRSILGPIHKRVRFTVLLEPSATARRVVLEVGGVQLALRRISPALAGIPNLKGEKCFTGVLLPGKLGAGQHAVRAWLAD